MLAGSLVVSHITSQWATWTAMISLLAIHLGTNYLAVRSVSMRTLNRQRANLVFCDLLEQFFLLDEKRWSKGKLPIIPTPENISAEEKIFEVDGVLRWKGRQILGYCKIGVELRKVLDLLSSAKTVRGLGLLGISLNAATLLDIYKDEGYIMWYDSSRNTFLIVLKEDSGTATQLKAWVHALLLAKQKESKPSEYSAVNAQARMEDLAMTLELLQTFMHSYDLLGELKKAGWDLDTGALETHSGTRIKVI
jgi:hypothetical protein